MQNVCQRACAAALDLTGKHGSTTDDVGEGGNDAAECVGQENVGVLTGIGGQFANEATS